MDKSVGCLNVGNLLPSPLEVENVACNFGSDVNPIKLKINNKFYFFPDRKNTYIY